MSIAIGTILALSATTIAIAFPGESAEFPKPSAVTDDSDTSGFQRLQIPSSQFIWLNGHILKPGDGIFLMDTSPYGVDAHFAMKIPCNKDGSPLLKLVNFAEIREIEAHLEYDPDALTDTNEDFGFRTFVAEPEEVAEVRVINIPLTLVAPNGVKTMSELDFDNLEANEVANNLDPNDPTYDTTPGTGAGKSYIQAYDISVTLDGVAKFNPAQDGSCIYHVTAENASDVFLVNDGDKPVPFGANDHLIYDINKFRVQR
ncbi:MAG: hypothetical protein ACT4N5_07160 [Nitrosopumilaceae archaeon]